MIGFLTKETRTRGVRWGLAQLVVACVTPISVVAAFLVYLPYERGQGQVRDAAISRARAMVSALDREFAKTESSLAALSTAPFLASNDLQGFHRQARQALKGIDADSIVVFATDGQMLLSTRVAYGSQLPKLDRAPVLKKIIATGQPGVSDLFPSPLTNSPIVAVGVPVSQGGAVVYSLNVAIQPERLSTILWEQRLPDSWRAAIADSSGTVVARTHDSAKFVGMKVTESLLKRMELSAEDAFEAKTLEGIPVLTAYSTSQTNKWKVVIGMPLAELTADIRLTVAWLCASILAAVIIGFALAWWLGDRIARSVTALVAPAQALGRGERMEMPPMAFKEADELGLALLEAGKTLDRARHDALHDVLTGLANRASFNIIVEKQLTLSRRNSTPLAILYIDLDGFKAVNDTHGHGAGDELLRCVAARLTQTVRNSDLAARLGGDEFAVALISANSAYGEVVARKLIEVLSAPYQLSGSIEARITASIGVAGYPESASDYDTLVIHADKAMYDAKTSGKNRVCVAA